MLSIWRACLSDASSQFLHRVQLPDELSALLGARQLQHYVSLTADRACGGGSGAASQARRSRAGAAIQRAGDWLAFALQHELRWRAPIGGSGSGALPTGDAASFALLRALAQWTRFADETLPVVESFLVARLAATPLATKALDGSRADDELVRDSSTQRALTPPNALPTSARC